MKIVDLILQSGFGMLDAEECKLFDWPPELLFGGGEPTATRAPEAIAGLGVDDWAYQERSESKVDPFFRDKPGKIAPRIPLRQARRELLVTEDDAAGVPPRFVDRVNPPGFAVDHGTPDSIARPNAAVFQIIQASPGIENPLIEKWGIQSLQANFYTARPEYSAAAHFEGAQYIFDGLCKSVGSLPVAPSLIPVLGINACAQAVVYSASSKRFEQYTNWLNEYWKPVREKGRLRLEAIARECHRWQDKALLPVLNRDRTVDELLTGLNMATCVVALQSLCNQRDAINSFLKGAIAATAAINQVLYKLDGDRLVKANVGDIKTKDGQSYRLNENHRWERVSKRIGRTARKLARERNLDKLNEIYDRVINLGEDDIDISEVDRLASVLGEVEASEYLKDRAKDPERFNPKRLENLLDQEIRSGKPNLKTLRQIQKKAAEAAETLQLLNPDLAHRLQLISDRAANEFALRQTARDLKALNSQPYRIDKERKLLIREDREPIVFRGEEIPYEIYEEYPFDPVHQSPELMQRYESEESPWMRQAILADLMSVPVPGSLRVENGKKWLFSCENNRCGWRAT